MKENELTAIIRGLAPGISECVAHAVASLKARIVQLEARTPEPGPQGEKGRDGVDGKDGFLGPKGEVGPQGLPGEPGRAEIPLAPDDIADQVASTVAMLAESPTIQRSQTAAAVAAAPRPRSFTFEHDENGKVVAAHEGGD